MVADPYMAIHHMNEVKGGCKQTWCIKYKCYKYFIKGFLKCIVIIFILDLVNPIYKELIN